MTMSYITSPPRPPYALVITTLAVSIFAAASMTAMNYYAAVGDDDDWRRGIHSIAIGFIAFMHGIIMASILPPAGVRRAGRCAAMAARAATYTGLAAAALGLFWLLGPIQNTWTG